jgi:hypothetical protein
LQWPAHLSDVVDLDRRALDPAIAAQLEHIRQLEGEIRQLCDQHLRAANIAVEVFWKCLRASDISRETARYAAVQEALRPATVPQTVVHE